MVFEINLLPDKYRKRKIAIQLDVRLLAIVGGIAVVAFIGWVTVNQSHKLSALETQVEELTKQRDDLAPRALRLDRNVREIENLTTRIQTLQGLGSRNQTQLQILEIVRTQMPDDLWLFDLNETAPAQPRPGTGNIPATRIVNFRGQALRKERITEFITNLQGQDLIQVVQMIYLRPARVEEEDIFEFSIRAILVAG